MFKTYEWQKVGTTPSVSFAGVLFRWVTRNFNKNQKTFQFASHLQQTCIHSHGARAILLYKSPWIIMADMLFSGQQQFTFHTWYKKQAISNNFLTKTNTFWTNTNNSPSISLTLAVQFDWLLLHVLCDQVLHKLMMIHIIFIFNPCHTSQGHDAELNLITLEYHKI